jgi:hypothetical protein
VGFRDQDLEINGHGVDFAGTGTDYGKSENDENEFSESAGGREDCAEDAAGGVEFVGVQPGGVGKDRAADGSAKGEEDDNGRADTEEAVREESDSVGLLERIGGQGMRGKGRRNYLGALGGM